LLGLECAHWIRASKLLGAGVEKAQAFLQRIGPPLRRDATYYPVQAGLTALGAANSYKTAGLATRPPKAGIGSILPSEVRYDVDSKIA